MKPVPSDIYRQLQAEIGPDARLDEPMSRHTSFRVGGPADLFVRVRSSSALEQLVPLIGGTGVPWRLLGGGTNVLVADAGIRGCILSLESDKPELELLEERTPPGGAPEVLVRIQTGSKLIAVARKAVDLGLGGLEWAIGLPGTVGGATVNNAGAHGADIAAVFRAATAVNSAGALMRLSLEDMAYSYRYSAFKGGRRDVALITVDICLRRGSREALLETARRFDDARKQRQPTGLTAGSVFKNPPGDHAGRLVEISGLKGLKMGGAQVSSQHGNFFMNIGGATAGDLYSLVRAVQDAVWERRGVWMEPEIELLGEWTESERAALAKPSGVGAHPSTVSDRQAAEEPRGPSDTDDPDFSPQSGENKANS